MRYFVRVLHSITPANKLQKHVLEQLQVWDNALVDETDMIDVQQHVVQTVDAGNKAFPRCNALESRVKDRWGDKPHFSVGLPMSEYQLCAISCTPVAYEYKKKDQ